MSKEEDKLKAIVEHDKKIRSLYEIIRPIEIQKNCFIMPEEGAADGYVCCWRNTDPKEPFTKRHGGFGLDRAAARDHILMAAIEWLAKNTNMFSVDYCRSTRRWSVDWKSKKTNRGGGVTGTTQLVVILGAAAEIAEEEEK